MDLRELIPALRSCQGRAEDKQAQDLLARIEPIVLDELHALAVHRGVDVADLAAGFLEALVVEAADSAWRIGVARLGLLSPDPEAVLLGSALDNAMRDHLRKGARIASNGPNVTLHFGFVRSGQPYSNA